MINDGFLEQLQVSIEEYLRGLSTFRGTPILTYKQSDIDSILRAAVGGGVGSTILILPPSPTEVLPNTPGPVFKKIICKVQVIENFATNRTGRSAIFIAERVMQYLHFWRPRIGDWNDELTLSITNPWSSTLENDTNIITLQFEINCVLKYM
ncbi:MAG: hypothetical protein LBJ94_02495 [Puniceicoccales bacterium]|jgi:hypothetical protein|nr:hypothetical protein [Puniceicoccales bacterium]